MTRSKLFQAGVLGFCLAAWVFPGLLSAMPQEIIIMRHGDKDDNDANHNLDAKGLQRSLALPAVLLGRYGKPFAIFAPQPKAPDGGNIRSIQLITPTAVQVEVNINTSFSVGEEKQLAQYLKTAPELDGKVVFIVWEHKAIPGIALALGVEAPDKWKSSDFDSLWIIKIQDGKPIFSVEHEGLDR